VLQKIKKKILIIILFFGIIISIIYSNIYWKNYEKKLSYQEFEAGIFSKDENALYIEGSYVGSWILGGKDVYLYFITAEEILRSFEKNKNFFTSQPEFKLSFLHPNIIAFFSYFTNDAIIENQNDNKIFIIGKKKFLIYLQILIYYISLFYLFRSIKDILGSEKSLFLIAFLSIEPTIMQWNISFMSESLFFSFLIFFWIFLLKKKIFFYLLSGIFFGLMTLQRFYIFYFIIFMFVYFPIKYQKIFSKQIFAFFSGFLIILSCLLISNYLRSKTFYLSPMQSHMHFPRYVENRLLAKEMGISNLDSGKIIEIRNNNWKKENEFNDKNTEEMRFKFYKYQNNEAIKRILKNKYEFTKILGKSFIKVHIINPLQMLYKYTIYADWNNFKKTDKFKTYLYLPIVYSCFIYFFILIGITSCNAKKNFSFYFLCASFVIYSSIISSIGMNERYFVPAIIFLAVFLSIGIDKFFKKFSTLK